MRHWARLALLAGISTLAACSADVKPELVAADTSQCTADIMTKALGVTPDKVTHVDAAKDASLPAYCEVTAVLKPVEGSTIGVVYRLPDDWNGKLLGLGGGGWAGNVTLVTATAGLKAGFATAQTDGGHPGTNPWDNSWASNPEAVTDFSHRAVHEMTLAGKRALVGYYGMQHDRAYFQGCSTGGRMALMEAQRYPEDYDAIISAAPVYTLQVQTSAILRNNGFAAPGAGFSEAQLKLANDAAVAACDMDDGVKDGLIGDPRACKWKPAELTCKAGQDKNSCLSSTQVATLQIMYDGARTADGSWAQLPMSKGGEAGWSMFVATNGGKDQTNGGGMMGLSSLLFGRNNFDYSTMTMADVLVARSSDFAKEYEAKNPDLSPFFGRGGKLLMWHGESDPGPSPVGTIDYVEAVRHSAAGMDDGLRMFLAPGVGHCRGGNGPDTIDTLTALDEWVKTGDAPNTLVATKDGSPMKRKLCAWPRMAKYSGKGDENDPASYTCILRSE